MFEQKLVLKITWTDFRFVNGALSGLRQVLGTEGPCQNLGDKQLQCTYYSISRDVKAIR